MAEYREFHCPYGDDFEGGDECDRCEKYELCTETPSADVIEIPKGATNGDMIKAMFPNCEITFYTNIANIKLARVCLERDFNSDYTEQLYLADWWNAPYKESEEE